MQSIKQLAIALVAAVACAVSVPSMAADSLTYKDTSGKMFSIDDVRQIDYDAVNAKIVLTFANGYSSGGYLTDNGTVFAKIKLDHPEFLTHGSNTLYVQKIARWVICQSGGTTFGWRNAGSETVADGCALATQAASAGKVNNP